MSDLTLAQAMEWLEERPRMHTEPQLVAAGRVLAAEIRRRDEETCHSCRDSVQGSADHGGTFVRYCIGPAHGVACEEFGNGCRAWQKREGK